MMTFLNISKIRDDKKTDRKKERNNQSNKKIYIEQITPCLSGIARSA
jgi:hypothetical protein